MNNRHFLLVIAGVVLLGAVACVDPFNSRDPVPPVIKNELEGARYYPGDVAEALVIEAVAADGGVLSYQWHSNVDNAIVGGRAITGATGASFTPPIDKLGTVYYYVRITNTLKGKAGSSVFSNIVEIEVTNIRFAAKPRIPGQPHGATYRTFDTPDPLSVTVTVAGAGAGNLSFQWYRTDDPEAEGEAIEGATDKEYPLATDQGSITDQEGITYFYVIITNEIPDNGDGGDKIASVKSNVVKIEVNNKENARQPRIADEDQPQSATWVINTVPSPLTVMATVSDNGSLSYQWYRNTEHSGETGTPIPRATTTSYTPLTNTLGTMYYYVIVTNKISDNGDGGEKIAAQSSNIVSIEVVPPPTLGGVANITGENNLNGYRIGETLTVHTDALTGAEGLSSSYVYRWRANGSNIPGANADTYTVDGQNAGAVISCEIRYPGVQGAVIANGLTVFYNIVIQTEGDVPGDSVMINPPYGHAGDTITLYYTVANTSSAEAEHTTDGLDFSGLGQYIAEVEAAGTGTRTYTVSVSDATEDGEIIIIATFTHDSRIRDPIVFTDATEHIHIVYGQANFTNIIQQNFLSSNKQIRYESRSPEIATVNEYTGTITTHAQGNTVITAFKTGDSTYADARHSYTLEVDHRPVQITGVEAVDKVYNGTDDAAFTFTGGPLAAVSGVTESGLLPGDDVTSSSIGAFAKFNDKNAGIGKTVTFDDFSLTGMDKDNYRVVQPEPVTADITQRLVSIIVELAETREYDGTTNASAIIQETRIDAVTGQADTGIVPGSGDAVSAVPGSATLSAPDVGARTVTFTGWTIGGADAGNYVLFEQPVDVSVTITPMLIPLKLTAITNKEFSPLTAGATLTFDTNPGNSLTADQPGFTYLNNGDGTGTLTYDGSTAYATPSITLTLDAPPENNNSFEPIVITGVKVYDGQVRTAAGSGDRRIPITDANFTEFNWYVFTSDGRKRHYKLAEDITLIAPAATTDSTAWNSSMTWNKNWKMVAVGETAVFIGSLDGQNHTIKNLAPWPSNNTGGDYASMPYFNVDSIVNGVNNSAGLFCTVGYEGNTYGIVENLRLDDFYGYDLDKSIMIGGIAARTRGNQGVSPAVAVTPVIRNCHVTGVMKASGSGDTNGVAGIVFHVNGNTLIEGCFFEGELCGVRAGGIAGYIQNNQASVTIKGCNVTVTGTWRGINTSSYIGGIVGTNGTTSGGSTTNAGTITGCNVIINGELSANYGVGGIAGLHNRYTASGTDYYRDSYGEGGVIDNCHVTGNGLTSGIYVGGITGYSNYGKITGSTVDVTTVKATLSTLSVGRHAAGIAGYASYSTISGCDVTANYVGIVYADSVSVTSYAGGIVGNSSYTSISSCNVVINEALEGTQVSGGAQGVYVGGIAGTATNNPITNCTVEITGILKGGYSNDNYTATGGIAGIISAGASISGCSFTLEGTLEGGKKDGAASASQYAQTGGIAGRVSGNTSAIQNCTIAMRSGSTIKAMLSTITSGTGGVAGYNEGTITNTPFTGKIDGNGKYNIGGIVGYNGLNGKIEDCRAYGIEITGVNQPTGSYSEGYGGAGGIAGYNGGTITNTKTAPIIVTGSIAGLGNNIGGIVGLNRSGDFVEATKNLRNYAFEGEITHDGAGGYIGGIAGQTYNTFTIERCYSSGTIVSNGADDEMRWIGGIVGQARENTTIRNCYSDAHIISCTENASLSSMTRSVNGNANNNAARVGGIVGMHDGTITGCYFAGTIDAEKSTSIGGIVGMGYYNSTIEHSYNTGAVKGKSEVGGIVGMHYGIIVRYCYNSGAVSAAAVATGGPPPPPPPAARLGGITATYNCYSTRSSLFNTVALGSATATGPNDTAVGRVVGSFDLGEDDTLDNVHDNYAGGAVTTSSGAVTVTPVSDSAGKDGETITSTQWDSAAWWQGLGFTAANGWVTANNSLPTRQY